MSQMTEDVRYVRYAYPANEEARSPSADLVNDAKRLLALLDEIGYGEVRESDHPVAVAIRFIVDQPDLFYALQDLENE